MDTRSSALFTYCVSGDDRLAKQAIIQIHNSFEANIGLPASRAPSHSRQCIPHFSLFWILMLHDHFKFFGEVTFILRFMPVADAILHYFHSLIDEKTGLVVSDDQVGIWNFVDWAEQWRPYGIPPAVAKTGVSTYTNHLYAYALKISAQLLWALGRTGLADEYLGRAQRIVQAINAHCFDDYFYTDGLASMADRKRDYSQHNQVWAELSGAATGETGRSILRSCLIGNSPINFTPASISMSFYTLRALSEAGGGLYEEHYHRFWEPWKTQLALGLTTWEEDSVSHWSDCHAWGSLPLYEFIAEVVGLRADESGYASISFEPRLDLYSKLEATVPLRRNADGVSMLANISWKPASPSSIFVHIRFWSFTTEILRVYIKLPNQTIHRVDTTTEANHFVNRGASLERTNMEKELRSSTSKDKFPAERLERKKKE
ncbi:glycoside hydrolase family 78 protein [Paramyrothecium foliicola]|nr:glycoside hydrolase family 78 protein [Paramyrothecium foliicola]